MEHLADRYVLVGTI